MEEEDFQKLGFEKGRGEPEEPKEVIHREDRRAKEGYISGTGILRN